MKRFIVFTITLLFITGVSPAIYSAFADTHGPDVKIETGSTVDKTAHEQEHHKVEHDKGEHHGAPHVDGKNLNLLWAIPFIGILLSIALFPLVMPHFWHSHYGKVSLFWGSLFFVAFSVAFSFSTSIFYLIEVYLLEFISFITLLLVLFTVAGGIRLKGQLIGTPRLNTLLILIGTALASWMGTTGAAMLMIRPLLRANEWRKYKTHTVVFFIFLVANIGGSLTPLGDPPLFLGFLKGVDFFWTTKHMLTPMLFAVAVLTVVYLALDTYFYRKEPNSPEIDPDAGKLSIEGKTNLILVPCVVGAVLTASLDLGPAFTIHHVTMPLSLLIEVSLFLLLTAVSLVITPKEIRTANEFTWEPIREVAKLFATIFITMQPPILMLRAGAEGPLGAIIRGVVDSSGNFINSSFFWATGALSSFLDNAPTYVVFFNTAGGNAESLMGDHWQTLLAISTGAVFMGANTYIGNAPNFMVKSIAEEGGIPMPSFFGYMLKYSIPILIPTFILVTLVFF